MEGWGMDGERDGSLQGVGKAGKEGRKDEGMERGREVERRGRREGRIGGSGIEGSDMDGGLAGGMEGWGVRDGGTKGQGWRHRDTPGWGTPLGGAAPRSGAAPQGCGVFLGRCVCSPRVWLDLEHRELPRLQPHTLQGPRGPAGELVAAFELLHEPQVRGRHGVTRHWVTRGGTG